MVHKLETSAFGSAVDPTDPVTLEQGGPVAVEEQVIFAEQGIGDKRASKNVIQTFRPDTNQFVAGGINPNFYLRVPSGTFILEMSLLNIPQNQTITVQLKDQASLIFQKEITTRLPTIKVEFKENTFNWKFNLTIKSSISIQYYTYYIRLIKLK